MTTVTTPAARPEQLVVVATFQASAVTQTTPQFKTTEPAALINVSLGQTVKSPFAVPVSSAAAVSQRLSLDTGTLDDREQCLFPHSGVCANPASCGLESPCAASDPIWRHWCCTVDDAHQRHEAEHYAVERLDASAVRLPVYQVRLLRQRHEAHTREQVGELQLLTVLLPHPGFLYCYVSIRIAVACYPEADADSCK